MHPLQPHTNILSKVVMLVHREWKGQGNCDLFHSTRCKWACVRFTKGKTKNILIMRNKKVLRSDPCVVGIMISKDTNSLWEESPSPYPNITISNFGHMLD